MFLRSETYLNENNIEMICDYYGYIDADGKEVVKATWERVKVETTPTPPEPTQLDRIEENITKLVEDTSVTDVLLGVE